MNDGKNTKTKHLPYEKDECTMKKQWKISVLITLVALLFAGCLDSTQIIEGEAPEPGSFAVIFLWEDDPPKSTDGLYVSGRVESRTVIDEPGTQIADSGDPIPFVLEVEVPFSNVPYRDQLVIVVEIKDGPNKDDHTVFFGQSDFFAVEEGKHVDVPVTLFPMQRTPYQPEDGDADDESDDGSKALQIVEATCPEQHITCLVRDPVVTLSFKAVNATKAIAANNMGFSKGLQEMALEGEPERFEWEQWDLNEGLCEIDGDPHLCDGSHTVFMKFANDAGYESPVLSVTVDLDTRQPALLASSSVFPNPANGETLITVAVNASESLINEPVLHVSPADLDFELVGQEGTSYEFVCNDTSEAEEGTPYTFSVDLEDLAGNLAQGLPISIIQGDDSVPAELQIDREDPEISDEEGSFALSHERVGRVEGFNTFTVDFMVTESLAVHPSVTVGGKDMTLVGNPDPEKDFEYTYSYTTNGDEGIGQQTLRFVLLDLAGNEGTSVVPNALVFDFAAPVVSSSRVSPNPAKRGSTLLYHVTLDEAIRDGDDPPSLTASNTGNGGRVEDEIDFGTGTPVGGAVRRSFEWTYAVQDGDSGVYDSPILGMVCDDLANCWSGISLNLLGFSIDTVEPVVPDEGWSLDPPSGSRVGEDRQIVFGFNINEGESLAGGYPSASLGAYPMNCEESAGEWLYLCTYTTTGDEVADTVEGEIEALVVELMDEAGNATSKGIGNLIFDYKAPELSPNIIPSGRPARSGERIVVTVNSSELPDENGIRLYLDAEEIASSLSSPLRWEFLVEQGEEDRFDLRAEMTDEAGNTAQTQFIDVSYDGKVPEITDFELASAFATSSADESFKIGPGIEFEFRFNVDDGLAEDKPPVVTFSNGIDEEVVMLRVIEGTPDGDSDLDEDGDGDFEEDADLDPEEDGASDGPIPMDGDFDGSEAMEAEEGMMDGDQDAAGGGESDFYWEVEREDGGDHEPDSFEDHEEEIEEDGEHSWQFVYRGTSPQTSSATLYTIRVELEDDATNQGVYSPTSFEIDNVPPFLSGLDVSPSVIKPGSSIRAVLTANEVLHHAPTLHAQSLEGTTAFDFVADDADEAAISYVYVGTVPLDADPGDYEFDDLSLFDPAQNSRVEIADDEYGVKIKFTVDDFAPVVTVTSVSESAVAAGQAFLIHFTVDETDLSSLTVQVGGRNAIPADATREDAYVYSFTPSDEGENPDEEGLVDITISATDPAGNVGYGRSTIEFDFSPPGILNSTVAPELGNIGAEIVYQLVVDEALEAGALPTLSALIDETKVAGNIDFGEPVVDGQTYTWTHEVVAGVDGDASGLYTVSMAAGELCDVLGNCNEEIKGLPWLKGFEIDADGPAISGAALVGDQNGDDTFSAVEPYNALEVVFDLSDDYGENNLALQVDLDTELGKVALNCNTTRSLHYSCSPPSPLSGQEGDGAHSLVITATDESGNWDEVELTVWFDFSNPDIVSNSVSPNPAKMGSEISYSVTFNEDLADDPVLALSSDLDFGEPEGGGKSFEWRYTVLDAEDNGIYTSTLSSLCDKLGNCTSLPGAGFEIDALAPSVEAIAVFCDALGEESCSRFSAVTGHNALYARVTFSEDPYSWFLTIAGSDPSGSCELDATTVEEHDYLCSHTVTDGDGLSSGTQLIDAGIQDEAGNRGALTSQVTYDFDAPLVETSEGSPDPAGLGNELIYRLSTSEVLDAAGSLLELVTSPSLTGWSAVSIQGQNLTWTRTVEEEVDHDYDIWVKKLCDDVGNCIGADAGSTEDYVALNGFHIDGRAPVISKIEILCDTDENGEADAICGSSLDSSQVARFSARPAHSAMAVRVQFAEDPTAWSVSIGGIAPSGECTEDTDSPEEFDYICTHTVVQDQGDGSGTRVIVANITDNAGNNESLDLQVYYDFDAPDVLSSNVTPQLAKLGSEIAYQVTVKEDLAQGSLPLLTIDGQAKANPDFGIPTADGQTYTWTHTVVVTDTSGEYSVSIAAGEFCDLLNNCNDIITGEVLKGFEIDADAPEISNAQVTGDVNDDDRFSAVAPYNAPAVSFELSDAYGLEEVSVSAELEIQTGSKSMNCQGSRADVYTCALALPLDGTEGEGNHRITITATDASGNEIRSELSADFDFAVPEVLSSTVTPTLAGFDQEITYRVSVNENLVAGELPALTVNSSTKASIDFGIPAAEGQTFTWLHRVDGGDTSGKYTVSIAADELCDPLGNCNGLISGEVLKDVEIDADMPQISNAEISGDVNDDDRFSAVSPYNDPSLSFELTDAYGLAGVTVAAMMDTENGPVDLTCQQTKADTYNCSLSTVLAGTEGEGGHRFTVKAFDEAGNFTQHERFADFDFTAPGVVSSTVAPDPAKVDDTIKYQATVNEDLVSGSLPQLVTSPVNLGFPDPTNDGRIYFWEYSVQAGDSGAYTAAIDELCDTLGNCTAGGQDVVDNMAEFAVDGSVPEIAQASIEGDVHDNDTFSADDEYNDLMVAFNVSDDYLPPGSSIDDLSVDVYLQTHTGNVSVSCVHPGVSFDYECASHAVDGSEGHGQRYVLITATDPAGNTDTETLLVLFDFEAPVVLTSSSSPDMPRLNSELKVEVTFDEALRAPGGGTEPQMSALLLGQPSFSFGSPANISPGRQSFRWQHMVSIGDDGDHTVVIDEVCDIYDNCDQSFTAGLAGFDIDATPPSIDNASIVGDSYDDDTFSAADAYNDMQVTFGLSDAYTLGTLSYRVELMIEPDPVTLVCTTVKADGYSCDYTVLATSGHGLHDVIIKAWDASGNEVRQELTVSFDLLPPAVVSTTVAPNPAKVGDQLIYRMTLDGDLVAGSEPSLTASGGTKASLDFGIPEQDGRTYSWELTITEALASGTYAASIGAGELCDRYNNCNLAISGEVMKGFEIDADIPAITNAQIVGDYYHGSATHPDMEDVFSAVTNYDQLDVSFDLTDAYGLAGVTLMVELETASDSATMTCSGPVGTTYTCSHDVTGSEGEGFHPLRISASDEAGNFRSIELGARFDFTDPSVMGSLVSPNPAKLNDRIKYRASMSEKLADGSNPQLLVSPVALNFGTPTVEGEDYIWEYDVTGNNGVYTVKIDELCDRLGNCTPTGQDVSINLNGFSIDAVVPVIGTLSFADTCRDGNTYGDQTGYNAFSLSFQLTDTYIAAAPTVSVEIATDAEPVMVSCTDSSGSHSYPGSNTYNYTCTRTVTSAEFSEGGHSIVIAAEDPAGNREAQGTTIFFDYTAPSVTLSAVDPEPANSGNYISYNISLDEAQMGVATTGAEPILYAILDGETDPDFDCGEADPLVGSGRMEFSWDKYLNPTEVSEGLHIVEIDELQDTCGNKDQDVRVDVDGNDLESFRIDASTPVIGPITISGDVYGDDTFSAVTNYNNMTISFNVTDAYPTLPLTVRVLLSSPTGSITIGCLTPAEGDPWVCHDYVEDTWGHGDHTIYVSATDDAGRNTTRSAPVTFDFGPPKVASNTVLPNPAKLDSTIVYQVEFEEALKSGSSPSLTATYNTATINFGAPTVNNNLYTWEYLTSAGDTTGSYTVTHDAFCDRFMNCNTEQLVGFDVDVDVPSVTDLKTYNRTGSAKAYVYTETDVFSAQSGYNTLAVRVTFDSAPSSYSITLDGQELTCATFGQPTTYQCIVNVTGNAGEGETKVIVATVQDPAGNSGTMDTAVDYDFDSPFVTSSLVSPDPGVMDTTLTYQISTDEVVDVGKSTLTAYQTPSLTNSAWGAHSGSGGRSFFWEMVVEDAVDAAYTAYVTRLCDAVANCANNQGARVFNIDSITPNVVSLDTDAETYSAQTGYNSMTITFKIDSETDSVEVLVRGQSGASCNTPTGAYPRSYSCSFTVTDADSGSNPRVESALVKVKAVDDAGNTSVGSKAVTFDFQPPDVLQATVFYTPYNDNPLSTVTAATINTGITAIVIPNETILTTNPNKPTMSATYGGKTLTFNSSNLTSGSVTFTRGVLNGDLPLQDGDYVPTVKLVDAVGNVKSNATFANPAISIKVSTPTLTVVQSQVTFVRSRWGNSATEALGSYTMPAGSYYSLAPGDPLSTASTLPGNTFSINDSKAQISPTMIRIWSDFSQSSLMGTASLDSSATWARSDLELSNIDTPTAWVTGIDHAGNESAAVEISGSEWVATSNLTSTADNPPVLNSSLKEFMHPDENPIDDENSFFETLSETYGADQDAILRAAEKSWREHIPRDTRPTATDEHAMAYDSARGRTVVFGGDDNRTWEWDGHFWYNMTPILQSPSTRVKPAMAYDSRKGVTFLFGGLDRTGDYLNDIWEWDGSTWSELQPSGDLPDGRAKSAMVYDNYRGVLVVHGGESHEGVKMGDTWHFDAGSWIEFVVGTTPSYRVGHAMVYDNDRNVTVFFGGDDYDDSFHADTWEWNGSSWSPVTPTNSPPGRYGHTMAYDSRRNATILYGGWGSGWARLADTWELGAWGTGECGGSETRCWREIDAHADNWIVLAGLENTSIVYDRARERIVLFGGESDTALMDQTWELGLWGNAFCDIANEPCWRHQHTSSVTPDPRYKYAMVYHPVLNLAILFGGEYSHYGSYRTDTWWWDGVNWYNATGFNVSSPSGRAEHAMAYSPGTESIVLFGGRNGSMGSYSVQSDTWEYKVWGTPTCVVAGVPCWKRVCWSGCGGSCTCTLVPDGRFAHGMSGRTNSNNIYMFGGRKSTYGAATSEFYTWSGTNWSVYAYTGPAARYGLVMRQGQLIGSNTGIILQGGYNGTTYMSDMWGYGNWPGTGWAWQQISNGSGVPGRQNHGFAYDSKHGTYVIHAGEDGDGSMSDTWEYSSGSWYNVTPVGSSPPRRLGAAMIYDKARDNMMIFGGTQALGFAGIKEDIWLREYSDNRRPGFTFTVDLSDRGFDFDQLSRIQVRAYAGGKYPPYSSSQNGVNLDIWFTAWSTFPSGSWYTPLSNTATVNDTPPYLAVPSSSIVQYSTTSNTLINRFIVQDTGLMTIRVTPRGYSGTDSQLREAKMALDYIELRLQYDQ